MCVICQLIYNQNFGHPKLIQKFQGKRLIKMGILSNLMRDVWRVMIKKIDDPSLVEEQISVEIAKVVDYPTFYRSEWLKRFYYMYCSVLDFYELHPQVLLLYNPC